MTEVNSMPVDATETSGAVSDEQPKAEPTVIEKKQDNDAFHKLLKEKKNAMARIQELETQIKERERTDLVKKEEWKTLAEQREKEIQEITDRLNTREQEIAKSIKMGEVRKELIKLGAENQYIDQAMRLIDFETVSYDTETGTVSGADSAAMVVKETLPPLFGSSGARADHSAPAGVGKPLTLEEWKQLPYEEQQKRKAELFEGMGIKTRR